MIKVAGAGGQRNGSIDEGLGLRRSVGSPQRDGLLEKCLAYSFVVAGCIEQRFGVCEQLLGGLSLTLAIDSDRQPQFGPRVARVEFERLLQGWDHSRIVISL